MKLVRATPALLFDLPTTTIPIRGDACQRFPVRRVYCVGQNYDAHAREMGNLDRKPPFFFMKPADAVVCPTAPSVPLPIPYPVASKDFHYEGELVVAIGMAVPSDVTVATALQYACGYAVGIDFTRRDIQAAAKKAGRPWEMGKSFDLSAPISEIVPASNITNGVPSRGLLTLTVNKELKQSADLSTMVWSVPEMIVELSKFMRLQAGDLIFTGTPSGVGAVKAGDVVEVGVEGLTALTVHVGAPQSSKL